MAIVRTNAECEGFEQIDYNSEIVFLVKKIPKDEINT
jgi:hypothetical protein